MRKIGRFKYTIILAILILLAVLVCWHFFSESQKCKASGGHYLKGIKGYECVYSK